LRTQYPPNKRPGDIGGRTASVAIGHLYRGEPLDELQA
jgi:hypothetical protein